MTKFSLSEARDIFNVDIKDHIVTFEKAYEFIQVFVFENKEHIIEAEKPLNNLLLLIEGKAKITMSHEDGTTSIVYFVKPDEMIGELTLIGIEKQHKDVIAIGRCVCLAVPMDKAEAFLLEDQAFMLNLSRYIGIKLLDRTWFNAKQQHYELKHRLAAYILLCECDGIYNEKHTQTAEYLAVSYRHLLHTIHVFREEGILIKQNNGFTFNRTVLESLASVLK